ncbi:hypothetical protein [Thiolapillus sp.]
MNKAFTPKALLNEILQTSRTAFPSLPVSGGSDPGADVVHFGASGIRCRSLLNNAFNASCGISPNPLMNKHIFYLPGGMKTA